MRRAKAAASTFFVGKASDAGSGNQSVNFGIKPSFESGRHGIAVSPPFCPTSSPMPACAGIDQANANSGRCTAGGVALRCAVVTAGTGSAALGMDAVTVGALARESQKRRAMPAPARTAGR